MGGIGADQAQRPIGEGEFKPFVRASQAMEKRLIGAGFSSFKAFIHRWGAKDKHIPRLGCKNGA
jgi:hypothetical protein